MADGRSNLNLLTKESGDQQNIQCPVVVRGWPASHRRRRQKRRRRGEASQNADLDEPELVDVKQGTKTVSEYHEEFLEKSKTLERDCDDEEEDLAWLFLKGLRQEFKEGIRAKYGTCAFCYISDVAYSAEKIEAKLKSNEGKLPLVFEESTSVDGDGGQYASEDEVESKPNEPVKKKRSG